MMADLKIRFGLSQCLTRRKITIILKFNIPLQVDIFLYPFWFTTFYRKWDRVNKTSLKCLQFHPLAIKNNVTPQQQVLGRVREALEKTRPLRPAKVKVLPKELCSGSLPPSPGRDGTVRYNKNKKQKGNQLWSCTGNTSFCVPTDNTAAYFFF